MSMFVHEYVNKIMRRLNDLSNQERFLRHVATSLQSLDDGAKQTFSDANGFKIVTDLQQIVTTASEKKQIPCHYGSLLESNLYKEQADFGLALCGSIFSIFSIWLYMAVYGSIWLYMARYGSIWLYIVSIWLYIAVYGYIWLYVALCGSIWLWNLNPVPAICSNIYENPSLHGFIRLYILYMALYGCI